MPELQPEQATFLLNTVFLPNLQFEHRITKSILEAIPAGKGDYRPNEIVPSALDLGWHIAAAEMHFLDAVAAGQFGGNLQTRPDSVKDPGDLVKWYTQNFEARLEKLRILSPEQLTTTVDFRGVFKLPAVMYLDFILKHSIHHRGQLSTYLRPMGATVPSIYGESYDAAQARKAAAVTSPHS